MHMVIRAIVYAKDREEAMKNAETIFQRLCEDGRPFDYYTMFRPGDDKYGVSGKSRWGDYTPVALATSTPGKQLIEDGMKYTEEEFKRALSEIKRELEEKTDDELLENEYGMFRYWCYVAGAYTGSSIWLYDNDGEGIRSREHLKNVLNKWADSKTTSSETYEGLKVFVVPADVHS